MLSVSTLSDQQRGAAEFDGIGAKTINEVTAELPTLRVGHNRFRCGRTLEESLGNDAYWHTGFSCNSFARINVFGVWCAVEDLPGWTYQQVGSELVVTDPCEGLTYHYQRPGGGANLGETPLKLAAVKRSGSPIRTYTYSGGGVVGNLVSQTDSSGDSITFGYAAQGSDTLLTVTGTQSGGGTRTITALYGPLPNPPAPQDHLLKSATWSNGGPARQYEFIVDPNNSALDGRINRVLDAAGNVLLDFDYDSTGRLVLTTRGTGPTFQTLNRQVYETSPGTGQTVDDTWMVSQCFVDTTFYQGTVRRFDKFNRIVEVREYHDLQSAAVPGSFTGEPLFFSGPLSVTTTINRGPGEDLPTIADIPGSFFTVERVLPGGSVAEYSVLDSNFNAIRTFMAVPGLTTVIGATLINEKRFSHAQFAGVWQTTSETDVARDNATTTMTYSPTSGFLTGRTMPSVSAANSGSGAVIPSQVETFTYDSVNKKRINTETRKDGQNGTIAITNTYDNFDYLATRVEVGSCDTHTTSTTFNAFGQEIQRTNVDGYVTIKVFDQPGHANNGSGLLLGQHTFASGGSGPVHQQTRYFYYASGSNRGRLERIEIADQEGSFTLGAPAGWQATTFAYDAYGRVTTKTTMHTTKPGTYVWTYAYDLQDRVRQLTYPDGMWVRTTREGRGLMVNDFVGSGGDAGAGTGGTIFLTNTYGYNANGMLIGRLNQSAADVPDHTTYLYDIYNRRTFKTDVDSGTIGYNIVTGYEYNNGMDVVRETVREGTAGPFRADIRRDFDELGRVWQERILAVPGTLNNNADRITTTTFDVRGNEVATRVTDTIVGDALTARAFTCFDRQDSTTVTLNNTETSFTDFTTDRRGNVIVMIDPVLNRTEHDYDAVGQRTQSRYFERIGTSDVLQLREDTLHTSRKQLARQTRFSATNAPLDQQRWEYDNLGFQSRSTRMADPASSASVSTTVDRVTDMTNDGLGRNLTRTTYDTGMSRTTTQSYDTVGRLTSITHPVVGNSETLVGYINSTRLQTRTITDEIGSRVMTTVFDSFGRLRTETAEAIAPAAAVTTTYQYDAANRRVSITDPLNIITLNAYDGIGQLTSVVEDSGGASQRTVTFSFTQKGDPLTVVADDGEGPQTTTYTHDRAGRRIKMTYPGGAMMQYAYDLAGRMLTRTAEDGFVTFYSHNWRGQAIQKRQTNAAGPILEEFNYDPLGRRTAGAVGAIATSQYKTTSLYGNGTDVDGDSGADPAYADEPAAETQTVAGVTKTIHHRHNTAGERSRLVYPEGANTTLDLAHQAACGCSCEQVISIDRNGSRLANYSYAGKFVVSRQVRTIAGPTETWVELAWSRPDQLRRPAAITNQHRTGSSGGVGGTVTALISYANLYDAASNLEQQTTAGHPIAAENGLLDHGYDRLHRLTASNYPNTTNDESWQLDKLGNWENHTDRAGAATTYTDNVLNQYPAISGQTASPLYDAKGNLVRNERGYGFTYDFENRLTRVFADNAPANGVYEAGEAVYAEYVVDTLGRRVQASIAALGGAPTTTYRYYDDTLVLAEFASDGPASPMAVYVNGPTYLDEHLLIRDGAGNEAYYVLKDLYTVAAIVDAAGSYLQAYAYTGYGLPTVVDFTGGSACTRGEVNGDGAVNGLDVQAFVNLALGLDTDPVHVCAADIDVDGDVDARDGALLAVCLLTGMCSSVCSPGDLNADGQVDEADAALLAQVLILANADPLALCAADLNGDALLDGNDIQPFVACAVVGDCPSLPGGGQPAIINPFFFTGQRLDALDPTTGPGGNPATAQFVLYDYKARVFDPRHGRFQQRDPSEYTDAYNLYEYALSRPTVLTDPTGRQFIIELTVTTAIQNGLRSLPLPSLAGVLAAAKQVAFLASAVATAALIRVLVDSAKEDCYCMCIRGPGYGPDPIGKMTRAVCKAWPYTGGAGRYSYCYCRGDP